MQATYDSSGQLPVALPAQTANLDLLVDFEAGRTLLDLGGLLMEMQEAIGTHVDVAMDRMLRQDFREQVLDEAILL